MSHAGRDPSQGCQALPFRHPLQDAFRFAPRFQGLGASTVDGFHDAVEIALPRQLQHGQVFRARRQRRFHSTQPLRPAPEGASQQCRRSD
jgi:hypothetical protein